MIRISELKTDYKADLLAVRKAAAKKLKLSAEHIKNISIVKKSLDARKGQIQYVYTVDVTADKEDMLLKKFSKDGHISLAKPVSYRFPDHGETVLKRPPVIAGMGPAGLVAGLMLARSGYRPVIFERGADVHTRIRKVEEFWETGVLDPQCNVQFGEGGAGTFSDGKLNTLVRDKFGRNRKVLEILHEAGAPEEILYMNKPHIGTDVLVRVVEHIRKEIIELGGIVHFNAEITDLCIEDGKLCKVVVNHQQEIPAEVLILAIGHSARNTFSMLRQRQLTMHPKAFAVGVRIEHAQSMIDKVQYGRERDRYLPAADYKLAHTCSNGRSVYTFCMCPGGYVVNASSQENATAVNGMSYSGRNSKNANSAVIVSVTPQDFVNPEFFLDTQTDITNLPDIRDPLCGMYFQQQLEQAAFNEAYRRGAKAAVPIQYFGAFEHDHQLKTRSETAQEDDFGAAALTAVTPVHKGSCVAASLVNCLPLPVCDSLIEGIHAFGEKIPGFDDPGTLLSAVESRTSSPVRIERGEQYESNIRGIYPCGEGAGYAGGITSAAMDGLKVAEAVVCRFAPPKDDAQTKSI